MSHEIERLIYLEKIAPYVGKDLIKVLVGQRRVGKSSLLRLIEDRARVRDPELNVISMDLEDYQFSHIKDGPTLMDHVQTHQKSGKNALFIDEIQDVQGFEKVVRSLNASGDFDIYLTGSNANLLSKELATLLAGRCIEIEIHSLSYGEFLTFHGRKSNMKSLKEYMKFGGLPYLRHLELKDEIVFDYLKNIVQTVIYRDVVQRHHIRNTDLLEKILWFIADNVGSLVSAKKISDTLKAQHFNTSAKTVQEMLTHLTDACILHRVRRFELKGRKVFESNDKYYFEDLGLRNALVGVRANDINQWMENIVYLQLKIRGFQVYVGKDQNREIDFVAEKNGTFRYYQVAYLLPDSKVMDREFGNLLKIKDQYPKTVISLDEMIEGDVEGVAHQHLLNFLMED